MKHLEAVFWVQERRPVKQSSNDNAGLPGASRVLVSTTTANNQREKQRQLRGELVRVEKNARRMFVQASIPFGREDAGDQTTHSVVASIKSAGTQRRADRSLSR